MKKAGILIPLLNEDKNIVPIKSEILKIFEVLNNRYEFKILFIDDGSTDLSLEVLRQESQKNPHIDFISLKRNYGQQIAILCGYDYFVAEKFDFIITLDCDLQDPIELIPKLIENWEAGSQVVLTQRINNTAQGSKRLFANLFYSTISIFSSTKILNNSCDFRLISFDIAEKIILFRKSYISYRILISRFGSESVFLNYHEGSRVNNEPSFTFFKSYTMALHSFLLTGKLFHLLILFLFLLSIYFLFTKFYIMSFLISPLFLHILYIYVKEFIRFKQKKEIYEISEDSYS